MVDIFQCCAFVLPPDSNAAPESEPSDPRFLAYSHHMGLPPHRDNARPISGPRHPSSPLFTAAHLSATLPFAALYTPRQFSIWRSMVHSIWAARKLLCAGGGGGMAWAPGEGGGGGGGFQKWASVPGPLFCVRTDVATKGAGTQILARKNFFTKKFPPTNV